MPDPITSAVGKSKKNDLRLSTIINQTGMYKNGVKIEITPETLLEYDKERFWTKVAITANDNLCWNWLGGKDQDGYGSFSLYQKHIPSNRAAYILYYDVHPKKLQVCHTCDNPSCCNPKHLFLGTNKDNQHDCIAKGRKYIMKSEEAWCNKLTQEQIIEIRTLREQGVKLKHLSEKFNIAQSSVSRIVNGLRHKNITIKN